MNSNADKGRGSRHSFVAFALALLALTALAAWQWRGGSPVGTDLLELLPHENVTSLIAEAEARMQAPVNRELIVLVHHPDEPAAKALAEKIGHLWRGMGLFETVQWDVQADLDAVRQQLLDGRLAMLPEPDRMLIADAPARFVEQRTIQLLDPVGAYLVPADQDWFGLAARVQQALPQPGNVTADLDGALIARHGDATWAVVRARTRADAFKGNLPAEVAAAVDKARSDVARAGGTLIAASGLLYAADGAQQARREMSVIGGVSLAATVALLLMVFRRVRVLLVIVPVGIGALAGTTACIAVFGDIHVLTLVLGASLIGVAIDYPLHVLSKCWAVERWSMSQALHHARPGLTLALATNVIGYLALAFTPLPALTQVAVFSAAGLAAAFLATLCLLPVLVGNEPLRPWAAPLWWANRLLGWHARLTQRIPSFWLFAVLAVFCLLGALRLNLHDDVRQWVARAPQLQAEAGQIAAITGFQPTSQFLLVTAPDETTLLQRLRHTSSALDALVSQHALDGYLSPSQIAMATKEEQDALQGALQGLRAADEPLQSLGIEAVQLNAEINALQALPLHELADVLEGPLGEPWRALWLGTHGRDVAAIVSLRGLRNPSEIQAASMALEGVTFVDRLAQINQVFSQTQRHAALLKVLACGLIFVLLCRPFGIGGAARVVGISLLAALCALASLGWLGQPLTLFGLFGLLLVTAIGVDYAILLRERVGGLDVALVGTLLSAITTWLSFGMLALSHTPAVGSFGITVTLGLIFSFLLAPWAAPGQPAAPTATVKSISAP